LGRVLIADIEKEVVIQEDVITPADVKFLYGYFLQQKFAINYRSSSVTQKIHQAQMYRPVSREEKGMPQIQKLIQNTHIDGIDRVYVQVYNSAIHPHIHQDKGNKTQITFLHPEYDINWGGELLIYDDKTDTAMAVAPKSGRTVTFNGNKYPHTGRSFNLQAPYNRLIFVVNYYGE